MPAIPFPLISVLLTVRGDDVYLEGAIRNVCLQRYRPLELILVDDGIDWSSTSLDLIQAICERESVDFTFTDAPARGRAVALNAGIRAANGQYIAVLDVDDRWHPQKLRLQMEVVRNSSDCLLGTAILSNFERLGISESEFCDLALPDAGTSEVTREVLMHCPLIHSSMLIPRGIAEALGGYDESRHSQLDWDIQWRAVREGIPLRRLNIPLTLKQLHAGQAFESKGKLRYLARSVALQWRIQKEYGAPLHYRYFILRRALIWLLPRKLKWRMIRLFRY